MPSLFLYLVANPVAGTGKGRKATRLVTEYLQKNAIPFIVRESAYQGHIEEIVAELAQTTLAPYSTDSSPSAFPLLVILGGDGSLHEAVNTMMEINEKIPMGYIPCGSGNDFARGAGISRKPLTALKQILNAAKPQEVPLIQYTSSEISGYFFNNMGIGLDASIVELAAKTRLKDFFNRMKLSSLTYVSGIFRALKRQKGFPLSLKTQGREDHFQKTLLCTITNHPYFGGGVILAPDAQLMEPCMEIVIIEKPTFLRLLALIPIFFAQKHLDSSDVFHLKTDHLTIECPTVQTIQTDGEILQKKRYSFQLSVTSYVFWMI